MTDLEIVTLKENISRGLNRNTIKTHCIQGHLLQGDNLDNYSLKMNTRRCRICTNKYSLERYHTRKRGFTE